MMRGFFLIAVLMAGGCSLSRAADEPLLDQAYRQMYNLDFDAAHRTLAEFQQKHPDNAMGPASDAAAWLYGEFDRMHILQSEFFVENTSFFHMQKIAPDPVVKKKFEADLARAEQIANRVLQREPANEDALLAAILRTGLESDYLALIEKKYVAALSQVKATRAMAERALAVHPDLYDAYLAIGEENYVLSQKAAPLRWVLQATGAETNKQTGIEKLRLTAEKGRYFAPYAKLLLAVADLRDKQVAHAREKLAWLAAEFPRNRLYREELAKLRS